MFARGVLSDIAEEAADAAADVPVPKGYKRAVAHSVYGQMWDDACKTEYQSLIDCNVLEFVKQEPWMHVMRAVWVFRVLVCFYSKVTYNGIR